MDIHEMNDNQLLYHYQKQMSDLRGTEMSQEQKESIANEIVGLEEEIGIRGLDIPELIEGLPHYQQPGTLGFGALIRGPW